MLVQQGRHNIVQIIFFINVVPQPQANISQVISLCNAGLDRNSHRRSSVKNRVIRNFTKFTENICTRVSFFAKACNFIKKDTLAQSFSCELCDISKTTFFTEHIWAAASAQVGPDKIVNYFSVKSCLRTVDQHCTGKFVVQFWLRQIKTTLHMVIFLRKDDYKQKQPFADVFQNRCF